MIHSVSGDILKSDAEAIVNPVNCVGVMGRGLALQFKKAFPANFKAYAAACHRYEVWPGQLLVFDNKVIQPRYIINFPTKLHWKDKSWMKDIELGLMALAKTIGDYGLHSIAIPKLGCGLGGLNWSEVRPRIESALRHLNDVRVILYEGDSA